MNSVPTPNPCEEGNPRTLVLAHRVRGARWTYAYDNEQTHVFERGMCNACGQLVEAEMTSLDGWRVVETYIIKEVELI